jgi:hypothetical protein
MASKRQLEDRVMKAVRVVLRHLDLKFTEKIKESRWIWKFKSRNQIKISKLLTHQGP